MSASRADHAPSEGDTGRVNTDWFRDARWGLFCHYLAAPASSRGGAEVTADAWNRRLDAFDVETYADQLESVGAGYSIFTLGQNSGHYCSPNATYDGFVGRRPGLCSRRDLIAELAAALGKRGIALLVYVPSHAPAVDVQAVEALGCTPPWPDGGRGWSFRDDFHIAPGTDDRLSRFQRNWEAVLREWSERWGRGVRGWWVDGVFYADRMYNHPDEPNFKSFAAALRAGNPDSIIAFNSGVHVPVVSVTEYEDYTAGELNRAFPTDIVRPPKFTPVRRWVEGAQYHVVTFVGGWWGQGEPRFCKEFVVGCTREINRRDGVVSWDIPINDRGLIAPPFLKLLHALRRATRE